MYRKVASSNTSCLEAHAGFFKLLMKGSFSSLCTVTFWQKVDFLISNACYYLRLGTLFWTYSSLFLWIPKDSWWLCFFNSSSRFCHTKFDFQHCLLCSKLFIFLTVSKMGISLFSNIFQHFSTWSKSYKSKTRK